MNISNIIQNFASITLDQMDAVSLLNRYDSKYHLNIQELSLILEEIKNDYFILKVNNEAIQYYKTTYFDTSDDDLYLSHHNGKLCRYKIRKRNYVNSGIGFLEIKKKNNKGKTNKLRLPSNGNHISFNTQEQSFLASHTNLNLLASNGKLPAKSVNSFHRITLVNKNYNERCTIDINLCFSSATKELSIDNMAIVELKQGKLNMSSPLSRALKAKHIHQQGFSKYCIGRAFLEPSLKQNLFKPKLHQLKKQYAKHITIKKINETILNTQKTYSYAITR